MGSASTQALAASIEALRAATGVDLASAADLFAASRVIGSSSQLSGALADPAASVDARRRVVADIFGTQVGPAALSTLTTAVEQRWSNAGQLVDGIEELATRAAAMAEPSADVESEIFEVSRLIAANPELELALGSRLGDPAEKSKLIETLLDARASAATTLIVSSLVRQPRERRVRQLLNRASRIVADHRGSVVATVTSAAPLGADQAGRLATALSARYGATVSLNSVIDPALVGGVRVQIADDVIDGSISTRLADLRHRLAG